MKLVVLISELKNINNLDVKIEQRVMLLSSIGSKATMIIFRLDFCSKYNETCHSIMFKKSTTALRILNWIFECAPVLNGLLPYED